MNLSRAITHLKMQLGLYAVALPFKDENGQPVPTENIIRDVLTSVTIPIYSQYQPWIREGAANLAKMTCIDRQQCIYVLPGFLTLTPIMYVSAVTLPQNGYRGNYGDPSFPSQGMYGARGLGGAAQSVASGMAGNMLAGEMRNEPTWEYIGENKIKLYGYPRTTLNFRVACEHEANGETIPDSCYESFMKLAKLDMQIFIWNNTKHFDGMPSAYGNVQLKIEDHQAADAERTTLLDQWNETFHLDMDWENWM